MSDKEFPSWHDLPFRLNNYQIQNPAAVITEFFETFHLSDIRTELQQLYDHPLGHESDDASTRYHSYTEVEKLIEAVWVIRNRINENLGERFTLINPVPPDIFGKKASTLELVKSEPAKIIFDIFHQYTLEDLRGWIKDMAFVATNGEGNAYDEADSRKILSLFIQDFYPYIEAVFILHTKINKHVAESSHDNILHLSKDEQQNHRAFLSIFFEKYPIAYLRRELFDWLEASTSFTKPWPENFHVNNVLEAYKIFLCLIEAGWLLGPFS